MTTIDRPIIERTEDGVPTEVEVLIAGSGFSGLGMAIRLQQEGHDDFLIL